MHDEWFAALDAEIERQDAALDEAKAALTSLGDVDLAIPQSFLDTLEDLCTPAHVSCVTNFNGVRA